MTIESSRALPDLPRLLAPLFAALSAQERPIFIALLERIAAQRYEGWAQEAELAARRRELLACAERERSIAAQVEGLCADAQAVQTRIQEKFPDLAQLNRDVFGPWPLLDQLRIQAAGERGGAASWRALAALAERAGERETLLRCAVLEEESAAALEKILAEADSPDARPGDARR